jgi:hypothetical protein
MSAYTHRRKDMFKYKSVRSQLREAQKTNIQLREQMEQTRADLEFVAIMAEVEIPEEEDQEGAE